MKLPVSISSQRPNGYFTIYDADRKSLFGIYNDADLSARIVACVNGYEALRASHARLLEVLKCAQGYACDYDHASALGTLTGDVCADAIASAESI